MGVQIYTLIEKKARSNAFMQRNVHKMAENQSTMLC